MSDPIVQNEQLRALVELARSQRAPEVKVTIEDVWRRGDAERAHGRGWIIGSVAALAAGLAAWLAFSPTGDVARDADDSPPTQAAKVVEGEGVSRGIASDREREQQPDVEVDGGKVEPPVVDPLVEDDEPSLALAEGVVFEPLGDAAPATVLSTWRVEVAGGRYRVETPANGAVLEIVVGRRVTRIQPGSKLTFDATRADDEGIDAATEPTAAELAQQAEAAMAAGRRSDAIAALTKLVRKHPRSAQARSGLVDLARLHKADGAWDRARCAYQLYLDRFPGASLRPEVERALYKLGEGKACNGLTPR